jgi:GNAT superfamily N-acetyltransferase
MLDTQIERLDEPSADDLRQLNELLIDCVEGGASVSFMLPMTREKAGKFWSEVLAAHARGERIVLAARDSEGIVGSVQTILDQPENQPHRADLAKMLVHRRARGKGVGAALLKAAEEAATLAGKTLLVLDTANPVAERLYSRGGWVECGVIPDYALLPEGGLCSTKFFYKKLGSNVHKSRAASE